MDSIKEIYTKFNQDLDSSLYLIKKSIELFEDSNIKYSKDLHYKIVEACFIDIFNCWEFFIEKSFIFFTLGYKDLNNQQYPCCIMPKDEVHAYNILKGKRTYPKWTDFQEIIFFSDLYFNDISPFDCLRHNPIELNEIKDIRNYISHKSENAQKCFKNVLIRNKVYEENLRPAEFLMMFKYKHDMTFLSYYCDYLKLYVDKISNSSVM